MEGEGFYLSEILDEDMATAMEALAFGSASSSDDSGFEVEDEEADQDEEMMPAPSEASATAIASSTASASTPLSSGDEALQCEVKPMKAIEPHELLELFNDFKARRAGIVKALTTEFESVYSLCDPEKENLCLFGYPNETWEVKVPDDEAPPDMPEPVSGINYVRRGMDEKEWLAYVADHSDVWLLALTFYNGALSGMDQESRMELFEMIHDLPTIHEVVMMGAAKEPTNESTPDNSSKSNKSSSLPPSPDVEAIACSSKGAGDK